MKRTIHALLLLLSVRFLSSCSETDYPTFDANAIDIYFMADSVNYSFGIVPPEQTEYTVSLPVQIIGAPARQDRKFRVDIVPEETNAQAEVHYRLLEKEMTLTKDSVKGLVPVTLLRQNLGETEWKLTLQLKANEHFNPTPQKEQKISSTVRVAFNNIVSKPNWKDFNGTLAWPRQLGPWDPTVYVVFMDYFHRLEQEVPATYKKITDKYGENLDRNFQGWDYSYDYTFTKYILIPMYQYFQDHPELGVTTFPNPIL